MLFRSKDEDFRENLGQVKLPEHPAGIIELNDESLSEVQGGMLGTAAADSLGCCTKTWDSPCTPTVK